jgi:mRNA-degrading endonuclease RelE of RelBE toxin-antitoxin system
LPEKVVSAVAEFIYGSLAESPRRVGKPLQAPLEGLYSARRGSYRIIYGVDESAQQVLIVAVEHRSDAYRPR